MYRLRNFSLATATAALFALGCTGLPVVGGPPPRGDAAMAFDPAGDAPDWGSWPRPPSRCRLSLPGCPFG